MKAIQAYRFALDLTPGQHRDVLTYAGAARVAHNPRHLVAARQRMHALGRALSRKSGPDRRASRWPSNRWKRAAGRLGKRTSGWLTTRLATTHGTVVPERNAAGSGPVAGRGADQRTRVHGQVAVKRQPGTALVGQTGTVLP
ncbi:hypothetical protein [Micromonospora sp. LOL_023]|uniref:hypothetical protein n=1 Tax=Micromonospora sp. LOL_023 TaxID=3345418 RepID=UPI003A853B8B